MGVRFRVVDNVPKVLFTLLGKVAMGLDCCCQFQVIPSDQPCDHCGEGVNQRNIVIRLPHSDCHTHAGPSSDPDALALDGLVVPFAGFFEGAFGAPPVNVCQWWWDKPCPTETHPDAVLRILVQYVKGTGKWSVAQNVINSGGAPNYDPSCPATGGGDSTYGRPNDDDPTEPNIVCNQVNGLLTITPGTEIQITASIYDKSQFLRFQ